MDFLHKELVLSDGDVVEVILNNAANVQLLDDVNFQAYRDGKAYHYQAGGYVTTSPFRIDPPQPGKWHLTVDLGGNAGRVGAAVQVLTAAGV